jgi:hypothetical protein
MSRHFELPDIEKGIRFPAREPARKPRPRPPRPSPWIAFLQSLEVGDCFEIEEYRRAALENHAKKLGIELVSRPDGHNGAGSAMRRFWKKADPPVEPKPTNEPKPKWKAQ